MIVHEVIDGLPLTDASIRIERDEALLHRWPEPGPLKIWSSYEPIGAISLPMTHIKGPFQPPRGVYESEHIHIEHQKMHGRQPFYHRNTDVDEISLHVAGERSVVTELGTVKMRIGDMNLIPVGVAHDNVAQDDVHLIFYIPEGVQECVKPYRKAEYLMPPFEGWKPKDSIEFVTDHFGAVGTDVSTFYTSEQMLLDNAKQVDNHMTVVRFSEHANTEIQWMYKSTNIWLGWKCFDKDDGSTYTRHRQAEELQFQMEGHRTLVTQRGSIEMEPGDFARIPLGCAHTSIAHEANRYLTVLMRYPADAKKSFSKTGVPTTESLLDMARRPLN